MARTGYALVESRPYRILSALTGKKRRPRIFAITGLLRQFLCLPDKKAEFLGLCSSPRSGTLLYKSKTMRNTLHIFLSLPCPKQRKDSSCSRADNLWSISLLSATSTPNTDVQVLEQFGFRTGYSTTYQLMRLMEGIKGAGCRKEKIIPTCLRKVNVHMPLL